MWSEYKGRRYLDIRVYTEIEGEAGPKGCVNLRPADALALDRFRLAFRPDAILLRIHLALVVVLQSNQFERHCEREALAVAASVNQ